MRKYRRQLLEKEQNPDENEFNEISYKKYTRDKVQIPQSTKNFTSGKIEDSDIDDKKITRGKQIISPTKDRNKTMNEDFNEDRDEKKDDDFNIEIDDIPLMRVRKMSFKSKEMGKIRSTIKLKEKISDAEKIKEAGGPLIDESKAKQAAEKYFKKRQTFLKHNNLKTETDFRRNKMTIDNFKSKNEKEEEKLSSYMTIATEHINRGGDYVNKNKSYIVPGEEMKNFLAEGGKVEKKEKKEEGKPIYNRRRYMGRYNSFTDKKEDDQPKNLEEKNFANKYAKITKNNNDNFKTVETEGNSRNNYYRKIKTNNIDKNEINNNENENEQKPKYNYRRTYKTNDKGIEKEENTDKKIYVRKAGYREIHNNDTQLVTSGYKRRYKNINDDNNKNELNQTEIKINRKTKLEDEDEKNKYSNKSNGRVKEIQEEAPKNKVSIRKRFEKKIDVENNNANNGKNEDKKIVVNTNPGFGRWRRY